MLRYQQDGRSRKAGEYEAGRLQPTTQQDRGFFGNIRRRADDQANGVWRPVEERSSISSLTGPHVVACRDALSPLIRRRGSSCGEASASVSAIRAPTSC